MFTFAVHATQHTFKVLCGLNDWDTYDIIYPVSVLRRHQIVAKRDWKTRVLIQARPVLCVLPKIELFWGLIRAFAYESHNSSSINYARFLHESITSRVRLEQYVCCVYISSGVVLEAPARSHENTTICIHFVWLSCARECAWLDGVRSPDVHLEMSIYGLYSIIPRDQVSDHRSARLSHNIYSSDLLFMVLMGLLLCVCLIIMSIGCCVEFGMVLCHMTKMDYRVYN